MKNQMKTLLGSAVLCAATMAVLAESNQTNTYSNGNGTNTTGDFIVGNSGNYNYLELNTGGWVSNASGAYGGGFIGYAGSYNAALVTGTNSHWQNNANYYVGYQGFGNQLIISNGGLVNVTGSAYMGAGNSSNVVTVTGSGSVFNVTGQLRVADGSGNNNQLIITDGGRVNDSIGFIGIGPTTASSNNSVLVEGAGSVWSNTSYVSLYGIPQSSLTVRNGGTVYSTGGYLGQDAHGVQSLVTVTDPGSVWNASLEIDVGYIAGQNQLRILQGGHVNSAGGKLGGLASGQTGSSNNTVTVDGSGSLWNNGIYSLFVGYSGAGNQLIITNGGEVFNGATELGQDASSSNNTVIVSGTGSAWNSAGNLYLGYGSINNQLIIEGGGQVSNAHAYVGNQSGSSENEVVVRGAGSVWSNQNLYLGNLGSDNQMYVTNGGMVFSAAGCLGNDSASSNNIAVVADSGSVWSNTGVLYVGNAGAGNRLTITNGGKVYATGGGDIGATVSSQSNHIDVAGAGSELNLVNTNLYAGASGIGNGLTVADGGKVFDLNGYVGNNGSNNFAVVTGSGAVWSNTGVLYVGNAGVGTRLTVTNRGKVYSGGDAYAGNTGQSNQVDVVGAGSELNVGGLFYVGFGSSGNRVNVTDGGKLTVNYISEGTGGTQGGSNNTIWISGSNSLVTVVQQVYDGRAPNNFIVVTNGGHLSVGSFVMIGTYAGATNCQLIVTGPGSISESYSVAAGSYAAYGTTGKGQVLALDGGVVDVASALIGGTNASDAILSLGGVLQFRTNNPTVVTGYPGNVISSNGVISYRNVTGADIYNAQVSNITFQGNTAFRLNNSTNTSVSSYNFAANNGQLYQRLQLTGNGPRWQSTSLNIGSGGELLVSNTTAATVSGAVTNSGTIRVVNSKVTFENRLLINGSYISDPSTNTYLDDVIVGSSGTMAGSTGDLFEFKKSLFISNTVNASGSFNLASSTVLFDGGTSIAPVSHTNAITGHDLGNDGTMGFPDGFTAANFSYGRLTLGSTNDRVLFTEGAGALSNALYVDWLDLGAFESQFGGNVSNMVTSLLDATAGITVYYLTSGLETNNAYLGNQVYSLAGGGFLMPAIPEPSALMLTMTAAALSLFLVRRQGAAK